MRKIGVLFIVMMLLAVLSTAVAQEATAEPTAEAEQSAQQEAVTRVRFANFAPDAPTLMVYADGQLTSVQQLQFPSISGWIEFTGAPTFMLAELGAAADDAVVGPFTADSDTWTTIAVVGSGQAGTLNAVAFSQNVSNIPDGCARVTVFHAIEGAPAVNITDDQGTVLVSGLGFAGGNSGGGAATSSLGACQMVTAEATAEAGSTTTGSQPAGTPFTGAAVQCTTLVGGTRTRTAQDAEATAQADMTPSTFSGSRIGNCGYTFDIPAGTVNLLAVPAGAAGSPLLDLSGTQLDANTYYFVAAVGTPDNPQVFVFSVAGPDISDMISAAQDSSLSAVTTPEATPEATPGS